MADKYVGVNSNGQLEEVEGLQTSAGAGDAGKIPALNSAGDIDITMLPPGVGADTKSIVSSENLTAGDYVNIWDDTGTTKVRKADASDIGKKANGFVLAGVTAPASATVYLSSVNNQLSSLTGGTVYYLDASTPGTVTATAPTATGNIVQVLGTAVSATEIPFNPEKPIIRA